MIGRRLRWIVEAQRGEVLNMTKTPLRLISALAVLVGIHLASVATHADGWTNITGTLANMPSECGNLTLVSPVPDAQTVIAGVATQGLWVNSGGSTWTHLGNGSGSDVIGNRPSWILFDPLRPNTFWESGIYSSNGGVFRTTDAGLTFHRLGTIWHNDYVSVDFSDPNRQTLVAGGHEQVQTVYRSIDGGTTWTNIGAALPANVKFTSHPVALGPQLYLVNAQGWSGTNGGIFRTTNGGATWDQVSTSDAYGPPLLASNGAIYWSDGSALLRSVDQGQTWTRMGGGLRNIAPLELPDGRLAAANDSNILVSADAGATWSPIGPPTPYPAVGMTYSPSRGAFFIWRGDCGNVVPADSVWQLDYPISHLSLSAPTNLRIVTSD